MDKELQEDVFKVASCKFKLIVLVTLPEGVEKNRKVQGVYSDFRASLRKCDIDIPELPDETDTKQTQFIETQIQHVDNCILEKSEELQYAYRAGYNITLLEYFIPFINTGTDDESKADTVRESISNSTGDLRKLAAAKDVDVSEELHKIKNYENLNEDEVEILKYSLKRKFCKTRADSKRSEVDPTRIITDDYWTISLVRLPDSGNDEHAFLVLEGKTGTTSKIWFADFVAKNSFEQFLPGTRDGQVRMEYFESQESDGSSSNLLFQCRKQLMAIRRSDRLLHSTWPIPKPTAEILLLKIKAQKEKPPKYNILGHTKLTESSAKSSKNPISHNCFTFAKMLLRDLNDEHINLAEDSIGTWVFSATSHFLVDKQFEKRKWELMRLPLMIALLVGGAVMAVLFVVIQRFL